MSALIMDRKYQALTLLADAPRTTRELADEMGGSVHRAYHDVDWCCRQGFAEEAPRTLHDWIVRWRITSRGQALLLMREAQAAEAV